MKSLKIAVVAGTGVCLLFIIFWGWFRIVLKDRLFDASWSSVIYDRHNELLGASIAADEQWRFPLSKNLPEKYVTALICFEDKRFYSHIGVDVLALARAIRQNIRQKRIISGASTITMQVIRLSRHRPYRTFKEKMIEMLLAVFLECSATKNEILELYAAHAPFGGNVVGLQAASWRYFGREADRLSWAESAMLAVLPNSPSLIHPGRERKQLKRKRDQLLARIRDTGAIDAITCRLAIAEPLPGKPVPLPMDAPHLHARIKAMEKKKGVILSTTLDKSIQIKATKIVRQHSRMLSRNSIHNAAALIGEVKTGRVVAYVGNSASIFSNEHAGFVDLIAARRSTGSILKPLLYAGMINAGEILPHRLVPDVPTRIGGFAPENFNKTYSGAVPASTALARSLNVPAVHMLSEYNVHRFYGLLKTLGMTTLHRPAQDYGLSLILGGAETTLWEITSIYGSIGHNLLENSLLSQNRTGMPLWFIESETPAPTEFPLTSGACFQTLDALLKVVRPGMEGAWLNFESSKKIAWKTGTSYGFKDAWAVGVTPEYVVGVWAGNADGEGRPGLTGIDAAAPILFDLFGILDTGAWFSAPDPEFTEISVCSKSGYRAGPNCPDKRAESVLKAGLKSESCPFCRLVHYDETLNWQVHGGCEAISRIRTKKQFVLPPVMEWYYKQLHSDYKVLPPLRKDCPLGAENLTTPELAVIYPQNNAAIYIPFEAGAERGMVVFKATHRDKSATLFWHLNNEYLGLTRKVHSMALQPPPGKHLLTIVDNTGSHVRVKFTILSREE